MVDLRYGLPLGSAPRPVCATVHTATLLRIFAHKRRIRFVPATRSGCVTARSAVPMTELRVARVFGIVRMAVPALRLARLMKPIVATLRDHVCDVVRLRTEKQMAGANAARIIAMVKHIDAHWNLSAGQFPCYTVGEAHAPRMGKLNQAVAMPIGGCSPSPAIVGLINLFPKSFRDGDGSARHFSGGMVSGNITSLILRINTVAAC